jgi:hypothetical protein
MSSTGGVQQLQNDGLLPSTLDPSVLNQASPNQLNQLANSSIQLQQVNALFGTGSSATDSVALSSTATNALLQEINPSQGSSSVTDPLTQAVNNELTSSLDAAVNRFLPQDSAANGSQINLLA